jgi:diguanylate cyclase (GGDEF)-like protein
MRRLLRQIWSAGEFDCGAVSEFARSALRSEARHGVYAMAFVTFVMMVALSCFNVYHGGETLHLYTFSLLALLAAHVAASARNLPDDAGLRALYLLGIVLLTLTALGFVLVAQRAGTFSGPRLSALVLLFMVVPLVPWGIREALLALCAIYAILTGSMLSTARRFDAHELVMLQFLMIGAAFISLALVARMVITRKAHIAARYDLARANEQLATAATHDALTGVKNRRFLDENYDRIAAAYVAAKQPFHFAVLDLDRFKALNDTWGHACGDRVLQRLAAALTSTLRREDYVVRMGGDEFAIITAAPDLPQRFERAVELFSQHDRGADVDVLALTVSLGSARVSGPAIPSLDAIYVAADQALYAAKAAGSGQMVEVELSVPAMEAAA